jgi:hypothetical protein
MDRDRLDRLARALGAAPTRRGLGRLFGAVLAAGAGAGGEPAAAAKKKPKACPSACPVCRRCRRGRCRPTADGLPCELFDTGTVCERGSSVPARCGNGGPCRVFATSETRAGSAVGGLAGADALCQSLAAAAVLGGTYRAWLSAGKRSPATRFSNRGKAGPYRLVGNGDDGGNPPPTVADSFADLTGCEIGGDCLQRPIDRDERGDAVERTCAWTGTLPDGRRAAVAPAPGIDIEETCRGWDAPGNGTTGMVGNVGVATPRWTNFAIVTCSSDCRLYCFEQA